MTTLLGQSYKIRTYIAYAFYILYSSRALQYKYPDLYGLVEFTVQCSRYAFFRRQCQQVPGTRPAALLGLWSESHTYLLVPDT